MTNHSFSNDPFGPNWSAVTPRTPKVLMFLIYLEIKTHFVSNYSFDFFRQVRNQKFSALWGILNAKLPIPSIHCELDSPKMLNFLNFFSFDFSDLCLLKTTYFILSSNVLITSSFFVVEISIEETTILLRLLQSC